MVPTLPPSAWGPRVTALTLGPVSSPGTGGHRPQLTGCSEGYRPRVCSPQLPGAPPRSLRQTPPDSKCMKSLLEATYGAGPQAQPQRLWVGRFSSGTGGPPRPEKQRGPCTHGLQRAQRPAPPQPHLSLPQAFRSRTSRCGSQLPTLGSQVTSPHLAPDTFWGHHQAMGQTKPSPWGPCNPLSTAQQLTHSFTDSLTPSLTHSLPPSLSPSLTQSLTHLFTHSFHSLAHSLTHSFGTSTSLLSTRQSARCQG